MGVKKMIAKVGTKAANKVADLSKLTDAQIIKIEEKREKYLSEMPNMNGMETEEMTRRLLAASSIEIYNAYLPQIHDYYYPLDKILEYAEEFHVSHNIRYFNITKWVTDKKENSLEKLVNVYEVLSNEECNIALIFNRKTSGTEVYFAVSNTQNDLSNSNVNNYRDRLVDALRGNFPGAEIKNGEDGRMVPCLDNDNAYSVAIASNIPTEKSEKFISQTIEKLLDGIVPENPSKEYIVILLATPMKDIDERKMQLAEFYSGLAPYASWQTNFVYNENDSQSSSATVGVNVGASAGIQKGQNQAVTESEGETDSKQESVSDQESRTNTDSKSDSRTETNSTTDTESTSKSITDTNSESKTESKTHTDSHGETKTDTHGTTSTEGESITGGSTTTVNAEAGTIFTKVGVSESINVSTSKNTSEAISESVSNAISDTVSDAITKGTTKTVAKSLTEQAGKAVSKGFAEAVTNQTGHSVANTVGRAVTNTLGKAVTKTAATTRGISQAINYGLNFGASFARSSTVTATIGKSEGIIQSFTNYNIKHTLELLENQMKRYEQSTALGMWEFAAYVLSEDFNVANNVAHSYLALTQGEQSYMEKTAINLWRGDMRAEKGEPSSDAKRICSYLRELRHPVFGLNPYVTDQDEHLNAYPAFVTATTNLTGKELAYSLNFPNKSIAGLPVLECAEFGRNIVSYDNNSKKDDRIDIGQIFHMNKVEKQTVSLSLNSLASHTFVTGSTGSGKSNTVYQIINEAWRNGKNFLIVEPAKGEYKEVFGGYSEVSVYGTNPRLTPLLKLNPFSFPEDIHVYEHIDRLVEIFNVCWPMYAAMPAVLKSAVEQSYVDCGWNMIESVNEYGENLYPSFADVTRNVKTIIDSSEYDAENKGAYKGSLLTRLQSLTNGINGLIFSDDEISNKELFDNKVIVDLSRVGSSETKSLIMGMLVLKLQEYRMTSGKINLPLRHITVLEEAHNLLKKSSSDMSADSGNLLGKSVEMLSNAIAEMRTYGEGFIIADQAPGLLDLSVIRNTNTKIIMRLPDQSDRELVGYAAGLDEDQINELAKLPCGVGAIYQNEWVQPVLCKINRYDDDYKKYKYLPPITEGITYNYGKRLEIAEMLSKGLRIDRETILKEIMPKLDSMHLSASIKVNISKILQNPSPKPRMTRLAPIMNELFPDLKEAIEHSYQETTVPKEWTRTMETTLADCLNQTIEDQVRRDIIQAVITNHIYLVKGNGSDLQKWRNEGGLR